MANQIKEPRQQLNYYKKKRNLILFFTLLPLVLGIIVGIIFQHVLVIEFDILMSIFIPLIIVYLVYINILRRKLSYYVMYYNYYHMLTYQEGIKDVQGLLFTKSWLKKFETDGYKNSLETDDYIVFHKIHKKLDNIVSSGHVLEAIVVAKHNEVDFYSEEIETHIEEKINSYEYSNKVKKQIFIQIKRYDELTESIQSEINEIINYKYNNQYFIHLNVGYSHKDNKVYFLCPKKRYPNKFFYYACQQVKKYCKIKVGD
jgi:hypothetical protein